MSVGRTIGTVNIPSSNGGITANQVGGQTNYDRLMQMHPDIRQRTLEAVADLHRRGIPVIIPGTGVYRSPEEQDRLYAQGRTAPGGRVTGAQGGESYHNHGLALDIWPKGKDVNRVSESEWQRMASVMREHGFTWGSDPNATRIGKDNPHFQALPTWQESPRFKNAERITVDGRSYPLIQGGALARAASAQGISTSHVAPALPSKMGGSSAVAANDSESAAPTRAATSTAAAAAPSAASSGVVPISTRTTTRQRDTYRDLDAGDEGDDVDGAQRLLQAMGYHISEEERRRKRYGETTEAAKQQLLADINKNPFMILIALFQALITGEWDSLDGLLQLSQEDIQDELSGATQGTYDDSHIRSGDGVSGTGRAHRIRSVEQLDRGEIRSLVSSVRGTNGASAAANLASRLVGQHEQRGNSGPMVQLTNGYTGDAWCGGFANFVFDSTMPGVYDQSDFRMARSFMREGREHNAFHGRGSSYAPKVGDAVMFSRGSDAAKGHVGIVTGYDPSTREVTYVSGNDGNAVRTRSFDLDSAPVRLLGFTDSQALAQAKGINVAGPVVASMPDAEPPPAAATTQTAARAPAANRPATSPARPAGSDSAKAIRLNPEDAKSVEAVRKAFERRRPEAEEGNNPIEAAQRTVRLAMNNAQSSIGGFMRGRSERG